MARIHLRESCSFPQSMYQQVNIEDVSPALRESFKNITSKYRLKESNDISTILKIAEKFRESATDKVLFDNVIKKLRESGVSNERKLWKFPVSRFGNKNGNNRIYPEKLWENVINNQRDIWQGGCGLADHPIEDDDPGEFKTSSIVWLDMIIDRENQLIWAIGTFVGEYGRLAQEIIEAGGRIGFSSSGFGELMLDGKTVNPDTYQIERTADIVTNPSQSVFGSLEDSQENLNIEYGKQTIQETKNPKSQILKENQMKVNAVSEKIEENKMSKIEKSIILKYVENMTSEAETIKNPAERLKETSKILEMVEESGDDELKEKVTESLIKAREELTKIVESAVELQNEFGSDLDSLKENVKDVAAQGLLLNEQVKDYEALCKALETKVQSLFKENQTLKAKLELKDKALETRSLKENTSIMKNIEKEDKYKEALNIAKREFIKLQETNKSLNEANTKLESINSRLASRLNETKKTMVNPTKFEEMVRSLQTSNSKITLLQEQVGRLQIKNRHLAETINQKDKEFESYKEDQKMENHLEPKFETYVGSQLNFRENKGIEIERYWNDLCHQYGEAKMKPYEKQIRGAKTYREAFNNFIKNLNKIDESADEYSQARISENIINRKHRNEYLKDAGMNMKLNEGLTVDEINELEYQEMKKKGFI